MESSESTSSKWWKGGLFAALLSAAIPIATFVQGVLQESRELALQKSQQFQQIRMAYMDVMVGSGVEGMEIIADFIADTEDDERIRKWASKQRDKARSTADMLKKRLLEEEAKAIEATRKLQEAEEKAARAEQEEKRLLERASADKDAAARAPQAAAEARKARAEVAAAEANVDTARDKVDRSKDTLSGKPIDMAVQMVSPKLLREQYIVPRVLPER